MKTLTNYIEAFPVVICFKLINYNKKLFLGTYLIFLATSICFSVILPDIAWLKFETYLGAIRIESAQKIQRFWNKQNLDKFIAGQSIKDTTLINDLHLMMQNGNLTFDSKTHTTLKNHLANFKVKYTGLITKESATNATTPLVLFLQNLSNHIVERELLLFDFDLLRNSNMGPNDTGIEDISKLNSIELAHFLSQNGSVVPSRKSQSFLDAFALLENLYMNRKTLHFSALDETVGELPLTKNNTELEFLREGLLADYRRIAKNQVRILQLIEPLPIAPLYFRILISIFVSFPCAYLLIALATKNSLTVMPIKKN